MICAFSWRSPAKAGCHGPRGQPTTALQRLLKVSAGTWTTLALLERLDDILGHPADMRLRFVTDGALRDIRHREVVIGFRNRRPTQERLTGRALARVKFAAYATPGAPDRWIRVLSNTPSAQWLGKRIGNQSVCVVNTQRNSLDFAQAGQGIALLPTFIGDTRPPLVRVGDTVPELSHAQWIVVHQDDQQLPEVRRTTDRMCTVLGKKTPAV